MKLLLSIIFSAISSCLFSQITGKVIDEKGIPTINVNIYIKNSYEGNTSDMSGDFKLITQLKGSHIIVASFIGYLTYE